MERFHQGLLSGSQAVVHQPQMNWKKDQIHEKINKVARVFEDELNGPEMMKFKNSLSVAFNLPAEKKQSSELTPKLPVASSNNTPKSQAQSRPQAGLTSSLNPSKMMQTLSAEKPQSTIPSAVEDRLRALFAVPEGTDLNRHDTGSGRHSKHLLSPDTTSKGGLLPSVSQAIRFTQVEDGDVADEHNSITYKQDGYLQTSATPAGQPNNSTINNGSNVSDRRGEVQLATISEQVSITNKSVDKDSIHEKQESKTSAKLINGSKPIHSQDQQTHASNLRTTAVFGTFQNDNDQVQRLSGIQVSTSSKAESQRRTIENIDNDFSRENKFVATEDNSPVDELPQMTESSVMRPSALPDEDEGIISREIFAALESFQKLTRDQPGFHSKLDQKLEGKLSVVSKSQVISAKTSRKSSLSSFKPRKAQEANLKQHTSADRLQSVSASRADKHIGVPNQLPSFKKPQALPPQPPTKPGKPKASSGVGGMTSSAGMAYKTNADSLTVSSVGNSRTESAKPLSSGKDKRQTVVEVDSTGGRGAGGSGGSGGSGGKHLTPVVLDCAPAVPLTHKYDTTVPHPTQAKHTGSLTANTSAGRANMGSGLAGKSKEKILSVAEGASAQARTRMSMPNTNTRMSSKSVGREVQKLDGKSLKTESDNHDTALQARVALTAIKRSSFKESIFNSGRRSTSKIVFESSQKAEVEPLFRKEISYQSNPPQNTKVDTGLITPRTRPTTIAASRLRMMTEVTKAVEKASQGQSETKPSRMEISSSPSTAGKLTAATALSAKLKSLKSSQFTPLFK
jgi:hypothetical protein